MAIKVPTETITGDVPYQDKEAAKEFRTDLHNWRLKTEDGRSEWEYVADPAELARQPQRFHEKYWLGLPVEMPKMPTPTSPQQSLINGVEFVKRLQTEGGSWGAQCDGPMFVTTGMVFAMYILGFPIEPHQKTEIIRYCVNTMNPDGGWPTYLDGSTTVFGTTLNYIMLRILGMPPEHPILTTAREHIHQLGSGLGIQTWGKFWLCVLNLYEWDGMIPFPPEVILMPRYIPVSPANWWMPVRNIYISMAYLYGHRFKVPENELIRQLRKEIYTVPYGDIDWPAQRMNISATDQLKPRTSIQWLMSHSLSLFETWKPSYLRKWALSEALFHIEAEVHNTGYLCITPVSWASNILALWHAHGYDNHWVQGMKDRWIDPFWMCREGFAASGTDGTQVWDTALTCQAICDSGLPLSPDDVAQMNKSEAFLGRAQLRENPIAMDHVHRHPRKGGWAFSTRDQGYVVSDVTSEVLRAILMIQNVPGAHITIPAARLESAVDLLLGLESAGGGYAAYEHVRGPSYMELFNITDSYENCMIEIRYAECTGSVIMALTEFAARYPAYRPDDIRACCERGIGWFQREQYPEGGWLGCWGVCFTFAAMFALQAFACTGRFERNDPTVRKATAFLLQHQNPDGGWGESLMSSKLKYYVQEPKGSQVHNTATALMALIAADTADRAAIDRGIAFVMREQLPTGDWLPGTLEGIYTPPCGYRYPMYKLHFTLRALEKYVQRYGDTKLID